MMESRRAVADNDEAAVPDVAVVVDDDADME
jgi:hypothetical protein